ncbi:CLUMA_CG005685, isoform A [Clunio marinus]|uniref:CLUMA_CG005685, isoform A n=1 Tax=Clunio marinus TaxID=568069 RepID=A0A1J1HX67_9DIPT|nr:CLUMA_CG005685, isoform A [Clunio marinus]
MNEIKYLQENFSEIETKTWKNIKLVRKHKYSVRFRDIQRGTSTFLNNLNWLRTNVTLYKSSDLMTQLRPQVTNNTCV